MTCRLCASLCAVFTKSWLNEGAEKGCSTTSGTSASAWSVTAFRFEHAPARAACRSDRHGMANRLRTRLPDHTSACARRRQELHLRRRCGNVGRCGCHQGGKHCLLEPLPTPSGGRGSLRPVNSNPQRQHQRQGRLGALIPARPCVPPLALPSCARNTLTCVALAMRRRSCTDRHRHHRRHRQRRFRRHHCRRAASRRRTAAAPTALSAPRPCAAPGTRQRQCLRQPDGRECWVLC